MAFYKCSNLTSVNIPETVQSIGESAFSGCTGLTSVEIPNSVQTIGEDAFFGCRGLIMVVIPNSVQTIGNGAFYRCSGLTSVEIPNSVQTIGEYAFNECYSLTSVIIGNSVQTIGEAAFYGCDGLRSLEFNAVNCKTCRSAFPAEIEKLTIGEKVTVLPGYVFSNFSKLTSVEIPNSVQTIGGYAFYYCTSLTSMDIPSSVTSIGNNAFYQCYKLCQINVDSENSVYRSIGGVLFNKDVTSILRYPMGTTTISYFIPSSVTTIDTYAFSGCGGLTSVTIPYSVQTIGEYVFDGCTALKSIYYNTTDPVTAKKNVFSNYTIPTLYVPEDAMDEFYYTMPWGLFEKIEPYDFSGISIDRAELSMVIGDRQTLKAETVGNLSELTWTTSDAEVATVDADGVVTAVAVGEAIITVSASDLNHDKVYTATCKVTVAPARDFNP